MAVCTANLNVEIKSAFQNRSNVIHKAIVQMEVMKSVVVSKLTKTITKWCIRIIS